MHMITVLTALVFPLTIECLECYTCTNVTHLANCNSAITCSAGEICHSELSTIDDVRRFTLGCKSKTSCPPLPTASAGASSLVGRSVTPSPNTHCSECCESGLCNRQLCQHFDHTCVDSTDCSAIGSFTNICAQADHVKKVCRRFCGLCSLVDGGWSQWNLWSACDSTCENGTMARTRLCNNPAPTNGGATCIGDRRESQSCYSNTNCPVPGSWSNWSPWGSCSATCVIGMQRRDRYCSNPYLAYGGDFCYGDGRDDRLCFPGPCADGGWSAWGSWESCSKSCEPDREIVIIPRRLWWENIATGTR